MKLHWYTVAGGLFVFGLGLWNLVDGAWVGAALEFGLLALLVWGTIQIRRQHRERMAEIHAVFEELRQRIDPP